MDTQPPLLPQSDPNYSPTLPALLDDHSGPRDHTSFSSPQQYPISVLNPSRPTPVLPPSHPRAAASSDSTPCPSTEVQSTQHFSPSPSPSQIRPTPLFPSPYSAPHYQSHFASSAIPHPDMDRYSIANSTDRHLRGTDKYPPNNQHALLDQRRMSEPAMYGNAASAYPCNVANLSNARHQQLQHQYSYVPPQPHATHSSPLRRSSDARSICGSPWKEDNQLPLHHYDSLEVEEPLSPLNPTFSGGESPPPMGMSGTMFETLHEDYGPSPPGTGTSTSSNAPTTHQQTHATGESSSASNHKQYAFISLPGNVVRKRPRRRYEEIERLYQCSWQDCTKAYGTLNHLNAHITMQKHGSKRSPNEFKELRKQWRKAKKEEAEAKTTDATRHGSHRTQHTSQHHSPHSMASSAYQAHNIYVHHPARPVQPIVPLDDSLAHQRDVYSRRSHRYDPFVSPQPQHSGIAYQQLHTHSVNTSNIPVNRLPANSTLLTPLSSYESSSMSGTQDFNAYGLYRGESRPRTGHGNTVIYDDSGRPRSGHVNSGTSHNRDRP